MAAVLVVMVLNLLVFQAEAQWEQFIPLAAWSIAGRALGVPLDAFGASIVISGIRASGLVAEAASFLPAGSRSSRSDP